LAYVQFIYPENSFELPEEAYFTPKYISNDNRYLIDWEQPENDNNPVLILVEP
ncbi:MAG TPA: 6-bladed beta-propeller, partial [Parabacteroides distasonis]|nr:6-bladed beta-propeller [Parabacteroides distasonis]